LFLFRMNIQNDKRISDNSSNKSLRISTITIDSEIIPPPIHFTTTINDPPMQIRRDSSHLTSRQNSNNSLETRRDSSHLTSRQNLIYSLETNREEINTEGNWSLLDNIDLYDKIFDDNTLNDSGININSVEQGNSFGKNKHLNPLSKSYDSSWIPEPFSSSPI